MMTATTKAPPPVPVGFCADCLGDIARGRLLTDPKTGIQFFYCSHNEAGGVFLGMTRSWQIFCPIDRRSFLENVALTAKLLADGMPTDHSA